MATRAPPPRPRPAPPAARLTGRNSAWRHLNNHDVISMPDKWEYPWYAAWDLAFHAVALAGVDRDFAKQHIALMLKARHQHTTRHAAARDFAKQQLNLMLKARYQHPNGQLPAYEWKFSDVNPPVHAWATLFQ